MWNGHPQNKHSNVDLKIQKVQKTINKGGLVLGDVADNLIKMKYSKDMTASDKENAVMLLIQMFTGGLTSLAQGNNLLNQARRNHITSVLLRLMSELSKKVPEDFDWLFVDNIVSRINKIKGKRQALRSNWLRTQNNCRVSPKTQRIDN